MSVQDTSTQTPPIMTERTDAATPMAAVMALLALFVVGGLCIQVLPSALPAIVMDWKIPSDVMAIPLALSALGAGFGTIFGGLVGDALGRRRPIIAFALLQGAATALCIFAANPVHLAALLFAAGVGLGGCYSLALTLLTEIVPAAKRGLVVGFAMMAGPIGMSICSLTAAFVLPHYGWEPLFLACGSSIVPLFIGLFLYIPESAVYLARFSARDQEPSGATAATGEEPPPALRSVAALWQKQGRGSSALLWLMFFTAYLLGSAVIGWLPVLLTRAQFPLSFAAGSLSSWIIGAMIGTLLSGWCISRFGLFRVALAFAANLVAILTLLAIVRLGPGVPIWLVVTLLVMGGTAMSGVITSLYTLAADLYPTEMRARGIGMADAIGRLGGVAGPFCGIYALDAVGGQGFFGSLGGLAALILLCFWLVRKQHQSV